MDHQTQTPEPVNDPGEAPVIPPTEPPPAPVQDPPADPDTSPMVVRAGMLGGPNRGSTT
jgi:hypothetical protein